MEGHGIADDGQAETGAAGIPGPAFGYPVEALEYAGQVLLADTLAGVVICEMEMAVAAGVALEMDTDTVSDFMLFSMRFLNMEYMRVALPLMTRSSPSMFSTVIFLLSRTSLNSSMISSVTCLMLTFSFWSCSGASSIFVIRAMSLIRSESAHMPCL